MLKNGILNPAIQHLLARFRHTNTIVIADKGFPFWPMIETIDISLTGDVPRVTDVLRAILPLLTVGSVWMATEFDRENSPDTVAAFKGLFSGLQVTREPHVEFKRRVPDAIGLIRTGDATPYANVILESA